MPRWLKKTPTTTNCLCLCCHTRVPIPLLMACNTRRGSGTTASTTTAASTASAATDSDLQVCVVSKDSHPEFVKRNNTSESVRCVFQGSRSWPTATRRWSFQPGATTVATASTTPTPEWSPRTTATFSETQVSPKVQRWPDDATPDPHCSCSYGFKGKTFLPEAGYTDEYQGWFLKFLLWICHCGSHASVHYHCFLSSPIQITSSIYTDIFLGAFRS